MAGSSARRSTLPSTSQRDVKEGAVDGDRRLGAFGGGNNRKVHAATNIARDVKTGDVRGGMAVAAHVAFVIELAAEMLRQRGLLHTVRAEEERGAAQRVTRLKNNFAQHAVFAAAQFAQAIFDNFNPVRAGPGKLRVGQMRRAIGAKRHMTTPCKKQQRLIEGVLAVAVHDDPRAAVFPAVAIRAMIHAPPVVSREAREIRHMVHAAGGEQHEAGMKPRVIRQSQLEHAGIAPNLGYFDIVKLHRGISSQFPAAESAELHRMRPVTREISVQRPRVEVARFAGVEHADISAASPQHERGAQAGGPGPDDADIVERRRNVGGRSHTGAGQGASREVRAPENRWEHPGCAGSMSRLVMPAPEITSGAFFFPMDAIIIVDLQKAFPIPPELLDKIEARSRTFPLRIFTQFINEPDSLFRTKLKRTSCSPGLPETELVLSTTEKDIVLEKRGYGLKDHQIERLKKAGVTKALVCGVDTDACVIGVVFSLFDAGIDCEVDRELCWSSTGLQEPALKIIREQFGTG